MSLNLAVLILFSIVWILCQTHEINHNNNNPEINNANASFAAVVLCTNSHYFCSGVIVDEKWVLTAAHCLHDLSGKLTEKADSVLVLAGTEGLSSATEEIKLGQALIRKSKTIAIHDNYTWEENFLNDIALIEMDEKLHMSERVSVAIVKGMVEDAAKLHHADFDSHLAVMNFCCNMYGYGPASSMVSPRMMQQGDCLSKHCHCLERIRSYKSPFNVLKPINFFLCDNFSDQKRIILCSGDNGGPIMCGGALRAIVTTIFHYSDTEECVLNDGDVKGQCGDRHSLNVFTDLCYHNKWLRSVIPSYPHQDELCRVNEVPHESHILNNFNFSHVFG